MLQHRRNPNAMNAYLGFSSMAETALRLVQLVRLFRVTENHAQVSGPNSRIFRKTLTRTYSLHQRMCNLCW